MQEQQGKARDLKAALLQHLPERLNQIAGDWATLCQNSWDSELANRLHQRLQNLSGTSGRHGLIGLSESSLSLEMMLAELMDQALPLTPEQCETGNSLVQALRHEMELARNHSDSTKPVDKLVYLLHASHSLAPGLVALLEEQGCTVLSFNHPDDVEGEAQRRLPDALIVDAEFLPRLGLLNRELAIQQDRQKRQVGVVCLSQTRDLEQRLLAMRSGVDAYFVKPFNTRELTEKVIELATPATTHYRVLIVEDDASQAEFAASILKKSGMHTRCITEPLQVIDCLDSFRPDLILMDLYMPQANGMELTTVIREHPDFITTPIVFLSGELDTDKQLQAMRVGGDDFLSKPIRPRYLINTVVNRIERAKALAKRPAAPGTRDNETGLFKRSRFYEALESLNATDHHAAGGVLCLTLEYSSPAVDAAVKERILAAVGSLLTELAEEQDTAARLEERMFALLALRPHRKQLAQLAEHLLQRLQQLRDAAAIQARVGIAAFEPGILDIEELVSSAETCSRDLHQGGQPIRFHDDSATDADGPTEQPLPMLIRQALRKESFQVLFQTLQDSVSGKAAAFQLKLRLRLPDGQPLATSEILGLAGEADLGEAISQWLIERALDSLEAKRAEGKQITLLLPQTTDTLFQGNLVGWLRDLLRSRQLVGHGLVFVYPISELSNDLKAARRHFEQLREMGIAIALSRFSGSPASLKVLNYMLADFVILAGPLLGESEDKVKRIADQIGQCSARIILPTIADPGRLSGGWQTVPHLAPAR